MHITPDFPERRAKPRIRCTYPARVRGQDSSGRLFSEDTLVDNISAEGMYLRLKTEINPEILLSIVFRFTKTAPLGEGRGALVSVEGQTVRAQKQSDGAFGVAVKIQNHHFL
jgi:hypothetical protein